jgi:lysophospholipase L1-like esterase
MRMRDILSDECAELSIPFCDLTDAFRKEGRRNVLHFAPYDFHCNAAGNRLIAEEVAKFICERGLVN